MNKQEAEIIREAADILIAVAESGASLPSNWRWPIIDELHGIAAVHERAEQGAND